MNILNLRKVEKGAMRAIFDLEIPMWKMMIFGMKLFEKDGKKFVGLPTYSVKGTDGKYAFFPQMKFTDKETQSRFCEKVLHMVIDLMAVTPAVTVELDEELPF